MYIYIIYIHTYISISINSNVKTKRFRYQNGTQKASKTMKHGAKREPKRAKEPYMTPFRNKVEQVSKKDAERVPAALALGSHLKSGI